MTPITPENYDTRAFTIIDWEVSARFLDDVAQIAADDCQWAVIRLPIAQKVQIEGVEEYILQAVIVDPDRDARPLMHLATGETARWTRTDIAAGIQTALASGTNLAPARKRTIQRAVEDNDASILDAEDADIIFQCRAFGRLIFG